jgi:hypothetical protein
MPSHIPANAPMVWASVKDRPLRDELGSALVDAGVAVRRGHGVADVPEPLCVSEVGWLRTSGSDLGA